MKNLYIDFDGVICDTIDITYKMLEKQKISWDEPEKITEFYKTLDWDHVLTLASPINEAWDRIKNILDSKKFNVSILTHVNSTEEAVSKIKYIRNYFKDITVIPVPKEISKTYMVQTKGSILIDDYVRNIIEWAQSGGIGIRFDLDLDGKGFKVIDKLDQILDIM